MTEILPLSFAGLAVVVGILFFFCFGFGKTEKEKPKNSTSDGEKKTRTTGKSTGPFNSVEQPQKSTGPYNSVEQPQKSTAFNSFEKVETSSSEIKAEHREEREKKQGDDILKQAIKQAREAERRRLEEALDRISPKKSRPTT